MRELIAYGRRKIGSGKIHGHWCTVCAPYDICKKRERKTAKEEIAAELEHIGDLYGEGRV